MKPWPKRPATLCLILQSPRRPCCQAGLTLAQAAEMRYEMLLEEILREV